jgi:hypothetical protein
MRHCTHIPGGIHHAHKLAHSVQKDGEVRCGELMLQLGQGAAIHINGRHPFGLLPVSDDVSHGARTAGRSTQKLLRPPTTHVPG